VSVIKRFDYVSIELTSYIRGPEIRVEQNVVVTDNNILLNADFWPSDVSVFRWFFKRSTEPEAQAGGRNASLKEGLGSVADDRSQPRDVIYMDVNYLGETSADETSTDTVTLRSYSMVNDQSSPNSTPYPVTSEAEILVTSYNMHGYNQGVTTLKLLIESQHPDIIMLREHWHTPANLDKFSQDFTGYTAFGCSALDRLVSSGPLIGRPYGGMMTLLKNELMHRPISECIYTTERFVVTKVGDLLLFNVYLPCVGTEDRSFICNYVLMEICAWRQKYPLWDCVIAGDFNSDLDLTCNISDMINRFLTDNQFLRCKSANSLPYTFVNESINYFRYIDYSIQRCLGE